MWSAQSTNVLVRWNIRHVSFGLRMFPFEPFCSDWIVDGYLPSTAAGYAFTVLFGISTLLHFGTAIRYRTWSMLCAWRPRIFDRPSADVLIQSAGTATACALLETLGWAGRLASSQNMNWIPFFGGFYRSDRNFFIMQICCLIIAPAFLAAAIYIILGYTINHVGAQYSPIKPKTYLWIFVSGDVFSLVIQAVGGGIASGNDNDLERANMGANIMVCAVAFWFDRSSNISFSWLVLSFKSL